MAKSSILVCNVSIESVAVFNPVATSIALSIERLAGNAISPKFTYNPALAPPLRKFLEETLPRLVTHTRMKDYNYTGTIFEHCNEPCEGTVCIPHFPPRKFQRVCIAKQI